MKLTRQGNQDDGLDRPKVTPAPAPADDWLIRLASVTAFALCLAALAVVNWLRKNIVVSRRSG